MNLMHAELRRLVKRRFTRWLLAIVVVLLAAIAVLVALAHQKPGPAAVAQAEAQAAQRFQEEQLWIEEEIRECERAQAAGDDWLDDCDEIWQWQTSQEAMVEWFLPPSFDFRDSFPGMITALVGLLAMYAFLVGASFVGAEWRSGGMMNLLLWRPRRLEVLGAKLGTLLGFLLGIGVVLALLWTAAFWLVAMTRGVTDTVTAGVWQSFGLTWVRGLALVLVAGAIGFALASLGRHIAMALGSAIAAFVVGVIGVGIVVALAEVRYPRAWLWPTYIEAWLDKSVVLEDWRSCESVIGFGQCVPATLNITWQAAGALIAAVTVLVLGAAMWQMRRRDVA